MIKVLKVKFFTFLKLRHSFRQSATESQLSSNRRLLGAEFNLVTQTDPSRLDSSGRWDYQ